MGRIRSRCAVCVAVMAWSACTLDLVDPPVEDPPSPSPVSIQVQSDLVSTFGTPMRRTVVMMNPGIDGNGVPRVPQSDIAALDGAERRAETAGHRMLVWSFEDAAGVGRGTLVLALPSAVPGAEGLLLEVPIGIEVEPEGTLRVDEIDGFVLQASTDPPPPEWSLTEASWSLGIGSAFGMAGAGDVPPTIIVDAAMLRGVTFPTAAELTAMRTLGRDMGDAYRILVTWRATVRQEVEGPG